MPLETVRGVYEKLSREAVEAQLTRPLTAHRVHQEHSHHTGAAKNGYQGDADDAVSRDDGKKSVLERTAAGKQNGRAVSAPTTPVHRPLADTDHDVTDDELPQRGLTQALVAQWRELEERSRADLVTALKTGTSRSRSLSGLALQRGDSPSPSRRAEHGRSDDGAHLWEELDLEGERLIDNIISEQGRSADQRQRTVEVEERRDVEQDGEEETQLPPPLMTQYMLAKFRDMEAETQIIAGLQTKDKKVTFYQRLRRTNTRPILVSVGVV